MSLHKTDRQQDLHNLSNKNKPSPILLTIIAPTTFLAIWSGGAILTKVGLKYTDTWSFLFLRSLIAFILLGLIFLHSSTKRTNLSELFSDTRNLIIVLVSGLLLQVLYLTFYFGAIQTGLSLGIIILILGMQPIITSLISADRMNVTNLCLLAICFIGLVVATVGYHKVDNVNLWGLVLSLFALMSITFGTIKQADITSTPIITLLIQTALSLVIFSTVTLIKGFYFVVTTSSLVALIWMGAIVSVGAYLLLMLMLKHSSANAVSTLFFLLPLLIMVLESLVFKVTLSFITLTGVLIVCTGLFFYQLQKSKQI